MSIRTRLTAWYAGLLAVILLIFGWALYTIFARSLWTHAEATLRTRAAQLASFVESTEPAREQGTFFDLADPTVVERFSAGGGVIQISDAEGRVINRSRVLEGHGFGLDTAVRRALAGRTSVDRAAVPGLGSLLVYTAPIIRRGSTVGVVQVATPIAPITDPLEGLRWLLLGGGTAAIAVAVAGGHLLARMALAPVDRITATARAIGAGALDRRLHLPGPDDEVRRLAQAFDEMLDRIDETLARERRFTADAAHELRTPLTILKGELDLALRRERPADAYRAALASMAQEVDRLVRLTEDLLTLARADAGELRLERQPIALPTLGRWVEEHFRAPALHKAITLEVAGVDALCVLGDADRLQQLLTNVVHNAIAYTPAGGRVRLTWDREGHVARVTIADTGCGVAPEHIPHLFERFYRADRSRGRVTGGSGLGLAIARWVAEAHGGRIGVESHLGRGTTISVWLPLAGGTDRDRPTAT